MTQELNANFQMVDPKTGRPTFAFLEYLRLRGGYLTEREQALAELAETIGGRQVIAGTGLAGGGPLSADVTLSLEDLGSDPEGSYLSANITVDAYGRVTAAANGGGGGGGWTEFTITNNAFQTGDFTGWTTLGAGWTIQVHGSSTPSNVLNVAKPNDGSSSHMTQIIDVSSFATQIDNLAFRVRGELWWESTFTDGDRGRLRLICYDGSSNVLGTLWSSTPDPTSLGGSGDWDLRDVEGIVPYGTREIEILLQAIRSAGTDNSCRLDSVRMWYQ